MNSGASFANANLGCVYIFVENEPRQEFIDATELFLRLCIQFMFFVCVLYAVNFRSLLLLKIERGSY